MNKASKLIPYIQSRLLCTWCFTSCLVTLPTVEVGCVSPYWLILVPHCNIQSHAFRPPVTMSLTPRSTHSLMLLHIWS